MKPDYSFQDKLIADVHKALDNDGVSILAAAPNAGKTTMTLKLLRKMFAQKEVKQVLVLCHGQSILRGQWDTVARRAGFRTQEIVPGTEKIDKTAEVILALPCNLATLGYNAFKACDMVVVDEAHHFYLAPTIKTFLKAQKPRYTLLLSGSPARLITEDIHAVGITLSEMLDHHIVSDPTILLWNNGYNHRISDYDKELAVNHFDDDETKQTLSMIYERSKEEKIDLRSKTMVVCQNKAQATIAYKWFIKNGLKACLCVSDHDLAVDSLDHFKRGHYNIAVVVNRGIIGFDYPELEAVIDISCSLNSDRIFQLVCRLIRKSDKKKTFIKAASDSLAAYNHYVMSHVVALSLPEYYYVSAASVREKPTPITQEFLDLIEDVKGKSIKGIKLKDLPPLPSFQEMGAGIRRGVFAFTTFGYVKEALGGRNSSRKLLDIIALARKHESPMAFSRADRKTYIWLKRVMGIKKVYAIWGIEYIPPQIKDHWTKETARKAITAYKNRYDMKIGDLSLYKYMLRHDREYFDKAMPSAHKMKWDFESALAEFHKYDCIKQFRLNSNGAYKHLKAFHSAEWEKIAKQSSKARQIALDGVHIAGEYLTLAEIKERYGVNPTTVRKRIAILGWNPVKAATTPPNNNFINKRYKRYASGSGIKSE